MTEFPLDSWNHIKHDEPFRASGTEDDSQKMSEWTSESLKCEHYSEQMWERPN